MIKIPENNTEIIKLDDIKPYQMNTKKHPKEQVKIIRTSIEEFGFRWPIMLNNKVHNEIIAGHGRYIAAKELGMTSVPVIYADDLSKEQVIAFRIMDNKSNESEWDTGFLTDEFAKLQGKDYDTAFTGFSEKEISESFGSIKPDIVEDVVEVGAYERAKSLTKIQTGDVYTLGEHRLMCGDSTEVIDVGRLMLGKKADMVFTDPPYNINMSQASVGINLQKLKNDNLSDEEFEEFLTKVFKIQKDNCKGEMFICCDWRKYHVFKKSVEETKDLVKNLIVWNKMNLAQNLNKIAFVHEFIIYTGYMGTPTKDINVWDCKREYSNIHLTPKPIEIISRAINLSSKEKDIVLDLFGGSGSTLIACEQTNRKCRMMEINPVFCQVIIDRWEKFTGLKAEKVN